MKSVLRALKLMDGPARRRLFLLSIGILINSLLEVLSVGMILPFITFVTQPAQIMETPVSAKIYETLGFGSTTSFLIFVGTCLFALMIVKNIFYYWMISQQAHFGYGQAAKVSSKLFARYLQAPYQFHLNRNSAELITTLDYSVDIVFSQVILLALVIVTEFCTILGLIILLIYSEPTLSATLGVILGICSLGLVWGLRRHMIRLGDRAIRLRLKRLQYLQQALASIKEVKALGREAFFHKGFKTIRWNHALNQAQASTLSQLPRPVLETMVVGGLLLVIIIVLLEERSTTSLIPVLGLFAMAALRTMPALNRLIGAYNSVKNGSAAVDEVLRDWTIETDAEPADASQRPPLTLNHHIEIDNISFTYENAQRPAVDGITIQIKRGSSVGLIGSSGAGKSTLVDIILGLLPPATGHIRADGIDIRDNLPAWHKLLGYVPQSISLIDDTLRNNVALGIEAADIDDSRIWKALDLAQLGSFCRSLPLGLDTVIGEHGARLSGGQRQRLGIARALYHSSEVLLLDEATSALDNENEWAISNAIASLHGEKTMIVIAHRLNTVRHCDHLIFLRDGHILQTGTFDELRSNCEDFRRMVQLAELSETTAAG